METFGKSYDDGEIENFNNLADDWWNEMGPMQPLHFMNPIRLSFIRQNIINHYGRNHDETKPFKGLSIIDIGCGGGILCEPMARLGGDITGVDLSEKLIKIAQNHAQKQGLKIDYQCVDVKELVKTKKKFDVVTALEVIEHVPNPEEFIAQIIKLLKPSGVIFLSTINRTKRSYLKAILGAEYIMRILPRGTHQWQKFIKPHELKGFLDQVDYDITTISGLDYQPFHKEFLLKPNKLDTNYILMATKK